MNLDKHELKLLVAALAIAPAGEAVRTALLVGVFDRPSKLNSTVASLHRCGAVLFDHYQAVIRVRADVVWKMLNEFGQQTELFTNERTLDAVLAENSRLEREITQPARDLTRPDGYDLPRPKPPEPPPPDRLKPPYFPHKTEIITDLTATDLTARTAPKTAFSVADASRVNRLTDSSVIAEREKKLNPGITDEHRDKKVAAIMIEGQITEQELMRELVELLDTDPKNPGEMKNNGGHWRVDWVRTHPKLLKRLLIQLRELIEARWVFKTNRAAWLESSLKNELKRRAIHQP